MLLTYRYRLLPSRCQHRALEDILDSQRLLYNAALQERIGAYERGVKLTCFDQHKSLTAWRSCDAQAAALPMNLQRATLKRLDQAYKSFFRRVAAGESAGLPRFRGSGWFKSFGFREFAGITLKGNRLRFKGMPGALKFHEHRPLPRGRPRACAFKRDPKGWTVSLVLSCPTPRRRRVERAVGVDLGITTFAALSDGGFIPSLRAARKAARRMRIARRSLDRKKRGSKMRGRARTTLARLHASIRRKRNEHLHQASARLVRDYEAIFVEKLNIRALANGILGNDVRDAAWGRFISMLRYKAERAGAWYSEVPREGTSQECSGCGARVRKGLEVRVHNCPHCGLSIDRDLNAARNILIRAGVGPSLLNVAEVQDSKRAGENLGWHVDHP